MATIFDVQQQHVTLIRHAMTLLTTDGILYFSTNFRKFILDKVALIEFNLEDISAKTIPEDFARDMKTHYCWKITFL
jgi:23S rRNA (guanine2445-N2)-methyltransferase / 23S rRNA (guanine2069-N7)-methyltransferase